MAERRFDTGEHILLAGRQITELQQVLDQARQDMDALMVANATLREALMAVMEKAGPLPGWDGESWYDLKRPVLPDIWRTAKDALDRGSA